MTDQGQDQTTGPGQGQGHQEEILLHQTEDGHQGGSPRLHQEEEDQDQSLQKSDSLHLIDMILLNVKEITQIGQPEQRMLMVTSP